MELLNDIQVVWTLRKRRLLRGGHLQRATEKSRCGMQRGQGLLPWMLIVGGHCGVPWNELDMRKIWGRTRVAGEQRG